MSGLLSGAGGSDREMFPPGARCDRGRTPRTRQPADGVGLCLSGGGFRAMLFHVGVLKRLNEAGWLPRLDRVSSVSGGSITAAVLGLNWDRLEFGPRGAAGNFDEVVTDPIRAFAHTKVDIPAVATGGLLPVHVHLRPGRVQVPQAPVRRRDPAGPSRPAPVRHQRHEPGVRGADALQQALRGRLPGGQGAAPRHPAGRGRRRVLGVPAVPVALRARPVPRAVGRRTRASRATTTPGYRSEILLSDGGVYDNMGIETVWKRYQTVLISDAGGHLSRRPRPGAGLGQRHPAGPAHPRLPGQVPAAQRCGGRRSRTAPTLTTGFFISTITDLDDWPTPAKRGYMTVDPSVTDGSPGSAPA